MNLDLQSVLGGVKSVLKGQLKYKVSLYLRLAQILACLTTGIFIFLAVINGGFWARTVSGCVLASIGLNWALAKWRTPE